VPRKSNRVILLSTWTSGATERGYPQRSAATFLSCWSWTRSCITVVPGVGFGLYQTSAGVLEVA